MARKTVPLPTDTEFAVLRVLWDHGPSTVRQVHDALADRDVRYTTTLKIMQKMVDKRLLSRNEREAAHIYRPAVPEDRTQRRLMDQMLRRAFGGSVKKLVAAAISSGDLTDQELSEIIALINEAETDDGKLDS